MCERREAVYLLEEGRPYWLCLQVQCHKPAHLETFETVQPAAGCELWRVRDGHVAGFTSIGLAHFPVGGDSGWPGRHKHACKTSDDVQR